MLIGLKLFSALIGILIGFSTIPILELKNTYFKNDYNLTSSIKKLLLPGGNNNGTNEFINQSVNNDYNDNDEAIRKLIINSIKLSYQYLRLLKYKTLNYLSNFDQLKFLFNFIHGLNLLKVFVLALVIWLMIGIFILYRLNKFSNNNDDNDIIKVPINNDQLPEKFIIQDDSQEVNLNNALHLNISNDQLPIQSTITKIENDEHFKLNDQVKDEDYDNDDNDDNETIGSNHFKTPKIINDSPMDDVNVNNSNTNDHSYDNSNNNNNDNLNNNNDKYLNNNIDNTLKNHKPTKKIPNKNAFSILENDLRV